MKRCGKCKRSKSLNKFCKRGKYQRQHWCKACVLNYSRTPAQKKWQWVVKLKCNYGITAEQYREMIKSQNGVCKICGNRPRTGRRLDVDHCHKTDKVRGLLCQHCNLALGLLKDSIVLIKNALEYLREKI